MSQVMSRLRGLMEKDYKPARISTDPLPQSSVIADYVKIAGIGTREDFYRVLDYSDPEEIDDSVRELVQKGNLMKFVFPHIPANFPIPEGRELLPGTEYFFPARH